MRRLGLPRTSVREGTAASLLVAEGLTMSYGRVVALSGVDIAVGPGEVVGLCGDNGAGKSTLVRILSGAQAPDSGRLSLDGKPVAWRTPLAALAAGVATIYQDLALAPRMSIVQNIFLGAEMVRRTAIPGLSVLDRAAMREAAQGFLERLGQGLPDMDAPVADLSGGQRQAVAIARALRWSARVVIMDEPTAALGVREAREVLGLVRALRDDGVAVLMVSHNMADVVAVTDRVVILKAGRNVLAMPTPGQTAVTLAQAVMTGLAVPVGEAVPA